MQDPGPHDTYPTWIVLISNLLSLAIYILGILLLYQFGIVPAFAYVIYILLLEFRLMSHHCVDCYYYGKTCAFGKGRLSCLLFPKGSPEKFSSMVVSWKTILPDFLAFIMPVLAGVVLLVIKFQVAILVIVIVLLLLGFFGNALVRGKLACAFCRQRELGCPAAQFFEKKQS